MITKPSTSSPTQTAQPSPTRRSNCSLPSIPVSCVPQCDGSAEPYSTITCVIHWDTRRSPDGSASHHEKHFSYVADSPDCCRHVADPSVLRICATECAHTPAVI